MTIDEARTLSELRDLLLKVQPLIEKAARFPDRSGGSTEDEPVCIPLSNGFAAHLIADKGGTLILFVRGEHVLSTSLAHTCERPRVSALVQNQPAHDENA